MIVLLNEPDEFPNVQVILVGGERVADFNRLHIFGTEESKKSFDGGFDKLLSAVFKFVRLDDVQQKTDV